MYICRLFHRDRPFEQIEARLLAEGSIDLGRDPAADWPLDDPEGLLSRIHCTLSVDGDALTLRDRSTNGTWLEDGRRAPRGEPLAIAPRQSILLGSLMLHLDHAPDGCVPGAGTVFAAARPAPAPPPSVPAHRDESLLEAFCDGAGLDASSFSGEDPVELMQRLGALYQQTVVGLAALVAERTKAKGAHQLDRTTIGAVDNNPFKWMPPRRLAQELLCASRHGYLTGADAVRASIEDATDHLGATATAAAAAVAAVTEALSPEAIGKAVDARGFSLRSHAAACWDALVQRHARLRGEGEGSAAEAFRASYARSVRREP